MSPTQFFKEVQAEIAKVVWPSRKETLMTTVMVFVMATIAGIFFLATDTVLGYLISKILKF